MIPYAVARLLNEYVFRDEGVRVWVAFIAIGVVVFFAYSVVSAGDL